MADRVYKSADKAAPAVRAKLSHQISVRLEEELFARVQKACQIQQHDAGQLARILIEWALPYYERARSVEALRGPRQPLGTTKVSAETQEELFTALRIILDRGEQLDIEAVSRILTLRAGQLAGGKIHRGRGERARSV